jgi:hypothetical protein
VNAKNRFDRIPGYECPRHSDAKQFSKLICPRRTCIARHEPPKRVSESERDKRSATRGNARIDQSPLQTYERRTTPNDPKIGARHHGKGERAAGQQRDSQQGGDRGIALANPLIDPDRGSEGD